MTKDSGDPFTTLLRRLARVPKEEIDAEERKYQQKRKRGAEPAKHGQIVPTKRRKAG
jgi:hypothetical protein